MPEPGDSGDQSISAELSVRTIRCPLSPERREREADGIKRGL